MIVGMKKNMDADLDEENEIALTDAARRLGLSEEETLNLCLSLYFREAPAPPSAEPPLFL